MDNFTLLVASFEDETLIQEFSLPLNHEKVEQWAGLMNVEFREIDSDLGSLLTEKTFTILDKKLEFFDIQSLKCYFVSGNQVNRKVDIKVVTTLMKLTEKNMEEAIAWLEIFPGLETSYQEYLLSQPHAKMVEDPENLKAYDLLEASKDGKVDKIEAIFSLSFTDPYCVDLAGKNALHIACLAGKLNVVDFICNSSKSEMMKMKSLNGSTPLDFALSNGNLEVVKALLNHGDDYTTARPHGSNVLHQVARCANNGFNQPCPIISLFVSKGVDINAQDLAFKQTTLHYAMHHGDPKMIQFLLDNGANPNIQDCFGKTPCHYAKEMGKTEVWSILAPKTNQSLKDILGSTCKKESKPIYGLAHVSYNEMMYERRELPIYDKDKGVLKTGGSLGMCAFSKYPIQNSDEATQLFRDMIHLYDNALFHAHVGCLCLIHGYSFFNGVFYIIYANSDSVDNIRAARGWLGKLDICLKLSKSLEFIHNQGIVARNVFSLNARATQHTREAISFGWADAGLVLPDSYFSDPRFEMSRAPESVKDGVWDFKTDIYSLSAVFFQVMFDHELEKDMKVSMTSAQAECLENFMKLWGEMRSDHPEDRPSIRDVHDRICESRLQFALKGFHNGEFKHQCGCPKVHPYEEIKQIYVHECARLMDENHRNQKRFMFKDDRKLNVLVESPNEAFVNIKWSDVLEKHIKKPYNDASKKELSSEDVAILENMRKFIFNEPTNAKLFTQDSIHVLETLFSGIPDKSIGPVIDILRNLVVNPISLEYLLHSPKIWNKIFAMKWSEQAKPVKVFILRLFTNLLSHDADAIYFCHETKRLERIIDFACQGIADSEQKSLLSPSLSLSLNLILLAPHVTTIDHHGVWSTLVSNLIKVVRNLNADEWKVEKKLILLMIFRLIHGYDARIIETQTIVQYIENWTISGPLVDSVIEIYRYTEWKNRKITKKVQGDDEITEN